KTDRKKSSDVFGEQAWRIEQDVKPIRRRLTAQPQSKLNWALERDVARRFGRGRFSRSTLICSRRANSSSQSAVVLAAPVSIVGCLSTPFTVAVGMAASISGSWL